MFVGKNIIDIGIFNKKEIRRVYNLIYLDGKTGISRSKRFQIKGITRDKEYDLTLGNKNSRILYFSNNSNGEAEKVTLTLSPSSKARKKVIDFDFAEIDIKGKGAQGNILTKYAIKKIKLKETGKSTLEGINIFYDKDTGKLDTDRRGVNIGEFRGDDKILTIYKDGSYEIHPLDLGIKFDPENIFVIEKYDPEKVISSIYYDGNTKQYFVKRFKIETLSISKKFNFLNEHQKTNLKIVSTEANPSIHIRYQSDSGDQKEMDYNLSEIEVKGWKAIGSRLCKGKVIKISSIH